MARLGTGAPLRGRTPARRLRVEALEPRTMLAGTWPGTVIHDASANLFTVDLDGGMALEYVGTTDDVMSDMAFSPLGKLYGVTLPWWGGPSELYSFQVDFTGQPPTVVSEFVGTISMGVGQGVYVNSLAFNSAGELFAAGYDRFGQNYLFKINPDSAGAQRVLSLQDYPSAGDLTFDSNGNMYVTTETLSGDLLRIPPAQNSFEVVGQTLYSDFYGLTYGSAPLMFAFREAKQVYQLNRATGQATLVAQFNHPYLDWIHGAATIFPAPTDLGPVDFRALSNQKPTLGELWYRVVPTRNAILTVDLPNVDPAAAIDVTLYRFGSLGQLEQLQTNRLRLDYEGTVAGAEYFVKIAGAQSNVDVRVTNLMRPQGNGAIVYGTGQDDTFEFVPGPPYLLKINGVSYSYNFNSNSIVTVTFDGGIGHDAAHLTGSRLDDVATLSLATYSGTVTRSPRYRVEVANTPEISFDGVDGNDSATLTGSILADTITLRPKLATVARGNSSLQVTDVETISVNGGAGADSATFTGTLADETVNLRHLGADFTGTGFSTTLSNVETISAIAGGGYDRANFADSPNQDTFDAGPTSAALTGPGFSLSASGFDVVRAESVRGGNDVALLRNDPKGQDTFEATPTFAKLSGNGFEISAASFRYVHAYGSPFNGDVALLYGNPAGVDTFEAWPDVARLSGTGYYNRVKSFRYVHAYSNPGGNDVALLYDHPTRQDTFEAWPDMARLYGYGYYNRVKSFRYVHAYATPGGNDLAILRDDPKAQDFFDAWPDQARLYGASYYNRARSFRYVEAYATPGYDDVAKFYDRPSGNDTFEAWPDRAQLSGAGYSNLAKSFRWVHAYGSRSGDDRAILHDSAQTDYLQAANNWARLFDQALSFFYRVSNFDYVKAISTTPGGDKKTVGAVDYVLELEGFWQNL